MFLNHKRILACFIYQNNLILFAYFSVFIVENNLVQGWNNKEIQEHFNQIHSIKII